MTKEDRIEAIKEIREFEADQRILHEYAVEVAEVGEYFQDRRDEGEVEESSSVDDPPAPEERLSQEEADVDRITYDEMCERGTHLEAQRDEMDALRYDLEYRAREIEALRYQLLEPDDLVQEAGRSLVNHSQNIGTTARGLVTDLFPYIYAASKLMSTRAISSYLEKNHNVKISAATIARALREPKKHIEAFAETVEPHARNLAEAHGVDILTVLKDQMAFYRAISNDPTVVANNSDEEAAVSFQYEQARGFIAGTWFKIAPELRAMAYKVIEEQLKEEANEQSSE